MVYLQLKGMLEVHAKVESMGKPEVKLWKFMNDDLTSHSGAHKWEIGKWYQVNGKLELCRNGFHCSSSVLGAFEYVQTGTLAEVEVKGERVYGTGRETKVCWQEMRVVKVYRLTKEMWVKLAIGAAQFVLGMFEKTHPKDDRPRRAIEAAEAYLTAEDKAAAATAAAAAARDAARAVALAAEAEVGTGPSWGTWVAKSAGAAAWVAAGPERRVGYAAIWGLKMATKAAAMPPAKALWAVTWSAWVVGAPDWAIGSTAWYSTWFPTGMIVRRKLTGMLEKELINLLQQSA